MRAQFAARASNASLESPTCKPAGANSTTVTLPRARRTVPTTAPSGDGAARTLRKSALSFFARSRAWASWAFWRAAVSTDESVTSAMATSARASAAFFGGSHSASSFSEHQPWSGLRR